MATPRETVIVGPAVAHHMEYAFPVPIEIGDILHRLTIPMLLSDSHDSIGED